MALKISKPIDSISVVSSNVHNVARVNSVERGYKALRQDSKAPTFCLNLSRNLHNLDEQLWLFYGKSKAS